MNDIQLILQQFSFTGERSEASSFEELTKDILQMHHIAQTGAVKAINQAMTLRNWLIGCYIVEYEQKGKDRAEYGDRLLKRLEEKVNIRGLNETLFLIARRFYCYYPQIGDLLAPSKSATVSQKSNGVYGIPATPSQKSPKSPVVTPASHQFETPAETLIRNLSFSHIREIMTQDDPLARYFYETECIKGTWSVKELRRQIATNLYYRSGASHNPTKLIASINPEASTPALSIRQPFTFEFLGLNAKEVIQEGDLEDALIVHLQDFLLELGKGFCFEARQRRMVIDEEYYYADLVFYNRLLHCNVIIELKNDEFRHSDLSQLNAYVSYFRDNEMNPGDNPPVGILLCTRRGEKMVEYALAGMDNHLFVSTYMLTLPDTKQLEEFLIKETDKLSL